MFEGLLQPTHLLIILVIALVVFGPQRLPELGRSLGKGVRDLRGSLREVDDLKQSVTGVRDAFDVDADPAHKRPTKPV